MVLLRLSSVLLLCALWTVPAVAKDEVELFPGRYLVFPEIEAGFETTLTVRVENRSNDHVVELSHIAVSAGGADSEHFIFGPLPTAPIGPHGSATFTVTFRPPAPGPYRAGFDLHYRSNGRPEKRSFGAHGTARPPALRVEPEILDFGTVSTTGLYTADVVLHNRGRVSASFFGVLFLTENKAFTFEAPQQTPVVIPAESSITVRFGFQPVAEGLYETGALLRVGGAERDVRIRVRGRFAAGGPSPRPNIEVLPVELNFGTVTTATVRTGVITVSNTTGTANATITGIRISDPVFSLDRWDGPVVVTAGTRVLFPVSFKPQVEKDYETTATVQTSEGDFTIWLVGRFDSGTHAPFFTASVSAPEITATVGGEFDLPFTLDDIAPGATAAIASCRVVLRFNSTLMAPRVALIDVDSLSGGMRTIAVSSPVTSLSAGDVLFSVPMIAALGDAETTPIDILAVEWFDASGDILDIETDTQDGQLTIGDIWTYGGVRLVNSNAGALAMEILPNPVAGKAVLRLSYQEPATLVVYDIMGNAVLSLTELLPTPGLNPVTFQADVAKLSAGTYYCRLSAGKFSLVRTMRIE